MNRDGSLKSLWQEKTVDYVPVNKWNSEQVYDVLIVGGGITGLTTALLLQTNGKKCIVAEAKNLGFGTTGGTTAHLNTMLDTPYAQIKKDFSSDDANLIANGTKEAINLIENLVNKYIIDCDFSYRSAILYAEKEEQIKALDEIHTGGEEASVHSDQVHELEIPAPFVKAYRFDGQAKLHPLKYITGLARAFEEAGGVIIQNCMVKDVTSKEGIKADTTLGTIKADKLVYATHIPPGVNLFSFRCAPYRSYVMAFTLKSGNYPTMFHYDMDDPYHYHRTHEIDGQKYVVSGGFDHKTGHNDNTEHLFTELENYLLRNFDIDTIAYKWSSQYYEPVDGLPYIGLMPGHDNIYVGTGYGGNGMILGTLAGKIITDLIVSKNSAYEKLLSPSRLKLLAGISNFIKENVDVVSMFIGKRLDYEHIKQLADLAYGEAKVIEWEGKPIALYKDDRGKIVALDPVCTHAGCIVGWNTAEKSWDCPCHGGRFDCEGKLLNGPPTKGLTVIDWAHL